MLHHQVDGEGVWQAHGARESTEDEVTHLDAVWWDDITEGVVILTEEFWEVMQKN